MRTLSCALLALFMLTACVSGPEPGESAPAFTLPAVAGETHSLADYRGKLVMVHFWADWCKSCREEFPLVQQYYETFRDDNFEIVAVNVGQAAQVSASFRDDFGITFPMLLDENSEVADSYVVETFPTNFVVNEEGKIIRKIVGWLDEEQIRLLIQANSLAQK